MKKSSAGVNIDNDVMSTFSRQAKKLTNQANTDSVLRSNSGSSTNSNGSNTDKEERRRRRLELNRKAAQLSRQRKKQRVQSLEHDVSILTRENRELRIVNDTLRNLLSTMAKAKNVDTNNGARENTDEQIKKDLEEIKKEFEKSKHENRALRLILSRFTSNKGFLDEVFDEPNKGKSNNSNSREKDGNNNNKYKDSNKTNSNNSGQNTTPEYSSNNSNQNGDTDNIPLDRTASTDSITSNISDLYSSSRNTFFSGEQVSENSNKKRKMKANNNFVTEGDPNKVSDRSPNAKYLSTYVSFPPQRFEDEEELDDSFW